VLKKLIIPSKRIESRTFNLGNLLESYVTSRISRLFDLFIDSGAEKAQALLSTPPDFCHLDPIYLQLTGKVRQMKVVNDCAERGTAL